MPRDVIIGGSSITNSNPWPTWATWIMKRYGSSNFVNTSVKGTGNEVIVLRAIQEAKKCVDPVVIVQLTNVDKWDWYVENPELAEKISHERHPLTKLDSNETLGFWSTGSHFPLWKQHYKENYLGMHYQMFRTLMLIHWFQLLCLDKSWDHYILFDSPILAVTEQQLNTGQLSLEQCFDRQLTDNALCRLLIDQIDFSKIYCPGLIGYAKINDLDWYSASAKGHPGSLVHYLFAHDIVTPALDGMIMPTQDLAGFRQEATVMQRIFDNY